MIDPTPSGLGNGWVRKSLALPDGGFIVVGQDSVITADIVIWKLNASGNLDTSYADNGIFVVNVSNATVQKFEGLTATTDGGFAVVLSCSSPPYDIEIWKFDNKYNVDANFGSNGYTGFPPDPKPYPTDIAETSDGGLIVTTDLGSLVKINPQHEIETNFWNLNNGPWVGTNFTPDEPNIWGNVTRAVFTTPDKGFLVVGDTSFITNTTPYTTTIEKFTFWKFDSNFYLDSQFGKNGIAVDYNYSSQYHFNNFLYFSPVSIFSSKNKEIVVASNSKVNNVNKLVIWRFH